MVARRSAAISSVATLQTAWVFFSIVGSFRPLYRPLGALAGLAAYLHLLSLRSMQCLFRQATKEKASAMDFIPCTDACCAVGSLYFGCSVTFCSSRRAIASPTEPIFTGDSTRGCE